MTPSGDSLTPVNRHQSHEKNVFSSGRRTRSVNKKKRWPKKEVAY